jgi:hypothetical protein
MGGSPRLRRQCSVGRGGLLAKCTAAPSEDGISRDVAWQSSLCLPESNRATSNTMVHRKWLGGLSNEAAVEVDKDCMPAAIDLSRRVLVQHLSKKR